jgi:hypothetical protein
MLGNLGILEIAAFRGSKVVTLLRHGGIHDHPRGQVDHDRNREHLGWSAML